MRTTLRGQLFSKLVCSSLISNQCKTNAFSNIVFGNVLKSASSLRLDYQSKRSSSTIADINFGISGTSTMETVLKLVKKIEKASFPIKETKQEATANNNVLSIVEDDIKQLNNNIFKLLDTTHPLLSVMARYYFYSTGKRFRPLVLLMLSKALHTTIPNLVETASVQAKQLQLAEIVEMIHTASLLHDDVLDNADTRRGITSIQKQYKSNKFAILSGDYLLVKYKNLLNC